MRLGFNYWLQVFTVGRKCLLSCCLQLCSAIQSGRKRKKRQEGVPLRTKGEQVYQYTCSKSKSCLQPASSGAQLLPAHEVANSRAKTGVIFSKTLRNVNVLVRI